MSRIKDVDAFGLGWAERYRAEPLKKLSTGSSLWLEGMMIAAFMVPVMIGAMAIGVGAWRLQGIRSSFSR